MCPTYCPVALVCWCNPSVCCIDSLPDSIVVFHLIANGVLQMVVTVPCLRVFARVVGRNIHQEHSQGAAPLFVARQAVVIPHLSCSRLETVLSLRYRIIILSLFCVLCDAVKAFGLIVDCADFGCG